MSDAPNQEKLSILIQNEAPKYKIIEFVGEFDSYSLLKLKERLDQEISLFDREVLVFNFAQLLFINSESISFVLRAAEDLQKRGKKLVIIQARPNVYDVLKVIGMFDTVPYYANLIEFLKQV